ncbi:ABC transporter ATP-binding protein [Ruicaihuangia caeni]|uniref:ABC transporter ATP-binding protein n=1 Tax=Ruicaihuangia caeni TaxID=3042517 RepID=UPI00338D9C61
MADLIIKNVHKSFGDVEVLKGIDISVPSGSFVSLLGASGCGKSTLLRCIAGLETVSGGGIAVGGEDVTALAPEKRDLSMMFQSYALFPHMSVLENVRFPLRMRGERYGNAKKQRELARQALEQVRMGQYAERMPRQLSGGQQQRVALARAIVGQPRVLLLDEPLSNLDARLREEMQVELIELQRTLGLTTVFVTHDQDEAMSMSDQVVLMRDGVVEQSGAPEELYRSPSSAYAADFLGAANLLDVTVSAASGSPVATLAGGESVPVRSDKTGAATMVLRQERMRIGTPQAEDDARVSAQVVSRVFRGSEVQYLVDFHGQTLRVVAGGDSELQAGERAELSWSSRDALVL